MTDDLYLDDSDLPTIIRSAGLGTDPTFIADLRTRLQAEHLDDGVVELTGDAARSGQTPPRRWAMGAAAAVVAIGIGAIALVAQRGDDSAIIDPDVEPSIGDTIDDPAAFLDGSTWVAVRRFDQFPSSRTPVFTAESDGELLRLTGNSGCGPVTLDVAFDRGTVESVAGAPTQARDDDQTTPYVWVTDDRLHDGGDGRFVVVRNGAALIEFARPDDLPDATADDLVGEALRRLLG